VAFALSVLLIQAAPLLVELALHELSHDDDIFKVDCVRIS